jgi:hypothetical protein
VELYTEKGILIGHADESGYITSELLNKIKNSETKYIYTSHVSYENKQIKTTELIKENFILLTPLYNQLKEVNIKIHKKEKKYLKLYCYFRSYQLNNNRVHYFMDGIVDYYINLKNKKVLTKIISNRHSYNKDIKQIDEKGIVGVGIYQVGIPKINNLLLKEDKITKYSIKDKNILIDSIKGRNIGFIKFENNNINLLVNFITKDNPKESKLFGNEIITNEYYIDTYHKTNNLNTVELDNLLCYKAHSNYSAKNKKDSEYQKINVIEELFIISSENVSEIKKSGKKWGFYTGKPTQYESEYWQNIQNPYYQPLPESIEKYIKENLTEVK